MHILFFKSIHLNVNTPPNSHTSMTNATKENALILVQVHLKVCYSPVNSTANTPFSLSAVYQR